METRHWTDESDGFLRILARVAVALAVVPLATFAHRIDWLGGGVDANWSTGGNWDGGQPPAFDTVENYYQGAWFANHANTTVNVDSPVTAGYMRFENGSDGYALAGETITLVPNNEVPYAIDFMGDNTVIGSDIQLQGDITIRSAKATAVRPSISGAIGEDGTPRTATIFGTTTISLLGDNSYSGGTISYGATGLELGHANALGSGVVTIEGATRFWMTQDLAIDNDFILKDDLWLGPGAPTKKNLTLNGNLSIDATGVQINEYSISVDSRLAVEGIISDNGHGLAMQLNNHSHIRLGNANNITGDIALNVNHQTGDAILTVANDQALGAGDVAITNIRTGSSTMHLRAEDGPVVIANDISFDPGDYALTVNLGGNDVPLTVAGELSGTANLTVWNHATLAGIGGITGNVRIRGGGAVSPGNSPGILTVDGNFLFDGETSFIVDLVDPAAGTGYDQLVVTGSVTLNYATLVVNLDGAPRFGEDDLAFILVNQGEDAIIHVFGGQSQGSIVNLGTVFDMPTTAQISYTGDFATGAITGGNDIVLYNFQNAFIPEPAALSMMLLGMAAFLRRRGRKRPLSAMREASLV